MKKSQADIQRTDRERLKRNKRKKKGKAKKVVLIGIGFIVIALAAFIGTIKLVDPSFDLKTLLPQKAVEVIGIFSPTETTQPAPSVTLSTTTTTTTKPTTEPLGAYAPIEQFKLNGGLKGAPLGNILSGGKVWHDANFIYHIVDGDGIYRFSPANETYTKIYSSSDKLSSLNLRGDYLYFVNEENSKLYKLQKGSKKADSIAENIRYAYVYDSRVYYVTKDNMLYSMDVVKQKPKLLYNASDNTLEFTGLSKKRVYFTVTDFSGNIDFITVDRKGAEEPIGFRESEKADEFLYPVMEDGYLYYYTKADDKGNYQLMRQKFGSDKTVTLLEKTDAVQYPSADGNRLFFAEYAKEKYKLKEFNMNTGEYRTLIAVSGVEDTEHIAAYHGGTYDFIIGKKSADGKKVYSASCIYTGSTNVMKFKDGKWKY